MQSVNPTTNSTVSAKTKNLINFCVEFLVVVDYTTINFMLNLYPNSAFINDYMNILFSNVLNQV